MSSYKEDNSEKVQKNYAQWNEIMRNKQKNMHRKYTIQYNITNKSN